MNRIFIYLALALAFTVQSAVAQQLPVNAQDFAIENLLTNPGFENGKYGWTASGGATATANTTAKGAGNYGYDWDSNGAAQTLVSTAVTVPNGLKGKLGVAYCNIEAASGTPTHTITVNDGTNDLVSAATITTSTSQFTKNVVYFQFPTSGSVKIKLASVASDEPAIYVDGCFLGDAFNVNAPSVDTDWQPITLTPSAGFGTTSLQETYAKRVGDELYVRGYFKMGTVAASTVYIQLPSGYILDTSKLPSTASVQGIGRWAQVVTGASSFTNTGGSGWGMFFYNGVDTDKLYVSVSSASNVFSTTTGSAAFASSQGFNYEFHIPISGWGGTQQAVRLDTVNWRVDANISGTNPALSTGDVSSYTGIESAALTLSNATGNGVLTAQIPCSSTNSPTGTTCSVGNESVGVSFNLPAAGDVMACVQFTHQAANSTGEDAWYAFEIVETPSNAQTITQDGKERTSYGRNENVTSNDNPPDSVDTPLKVCSPFHFTSAGQKTLRLFYEQDTGSTIDGSAIVTDASASVGQRAVHWDVYPINQAMPVPYLTGSVTSSSTDKQMRVESASLAAPSGGACAVTEPGGDWINGNATSSGTGLCALTFNSGVFSSAPTCIVSINESGGYSAQTSVPATTSGVTTRVIDTSAQIAASKAVNIICMGPR